MLLHSEDLAEMIYKRLVKSGYAATEEECSDLADLFFDLMIELGLMQELDNLDELDELE